jgi:hypothetical protein
MPAVRYTSAQRAPGEQPGRLKDFSTPLARM